jgi:hypothetical protein
MRQRYLLFKKYAKGLLHRYYIRLLIDPVTVAKIVLVTKWLLSFRKGNEPFQRGLDTLAIACIRQKHGGHWVVIMRK